MADSGVDGVLVVSFGGPNAHEEVMPFLRNVTRGRNVPEDRLLSVAEHYYAVGGKSPINEQNIELVNALRTELDTYGPRLPVYWGNRNWNPFLTDALREMRDAGHKKVIAFVTSAFSSYSGCRQYREDIERAREEVEGAPDIIKIRQFFNHPGFVDPMVDNVKAALSQLPAEEVDAARLVFTAHSVPTSMARNSRYEAQLEEASRIVASKVGAHKWDLVYQSRSGPPHIPWLEPDVNDQLRKISADGVTAAVVIPIGFISDHMEVVHDLDDEARETAREIGLFFARSRTVGTDPRFISMIRELIVEHIEQPDDKLAIGDMGPISCLAGRCCLEPLSGD